MKHFTTWLVVGIVLVAGVFFYLHRPVHIANTPTILGHGGMGVQSSYPLNSSGSINKALGYPIAGTEIDVKFSSDGELIAFHDSKLELSSNCNGTVATSLSKDLLECNYESFFHSENICSLNSILESDYPDGTIFSLDLKPDEQIKGDLMLDFHKSLIETINAFPQYQFLLESQSIELLTNIKLHNPNATFFFYGHEPNEAIQLALDKSLDGVSINMENVSKADIKSAQSKGIQIMIWGCGSVISNRDALELEADIVQTDAIPSMVRILD